MISSGRTSIQFFKFVVVGLSNTAIAYFIYFFLVYFGVHYLVASITSFAVSVLNAFFWNHRFVFKDETGGKRNVMHSLIKTYVSYAFTGIVVQNVLLFTFIDVLLLSKYIAPLLALFVTVPLNFFLNKRWAFRLAKSNKEGN